MSESFSIPTPGDVIAGKYRVIEELGRGAYGVVFRAEQAELGRSVALKTLLPQAFLQTDIVQRFHREAQLISLLDHGNIIKLFDYGVDEGLLYMAVEYAEGRTLDELLKAEAPIPPLKVREIIFQLLDALEYAHSKGVVHRDLKPDNIILLKSRPLEGIVEEVVKVLDFGIAKLQQDEHGEGALKTLTQDGTVLGTPHYMSPENIVGDPIDYRADLYAVGVIMFEMLTGEHPFEAPSPSAVMVRHLRDDPPHLPGDLAGSTLDAAVMACLEKQPEDRIESAVALRKLLESNATVEVREPKAATEEIASQGKPPISPYVSAVIGAMLMFLVVSIGWKLWMANEAIQGEQADADAGQVVAVEPDLGASNDLGDEKAQAASDLGGIAESVVDAGSDADEQDFEFSMEEGLPVHKERKPRKPKVTPPEKDEKAVAKVQVMITSTPSNASVTIDGTPVGNTPLTTRIAGGDAAVKVRVSLLGYKNRTFKVVPDKDVQIDARLEYERIKMLD